MFKELKENMDKELEKTKKTIKNENENININYFKNSGAQKYNNEMKISLNPREIQLRI